jgi:hypothetical protein
MGQPLKKKKQTSYLNSEFFRDGGYKPTGRQFPERYYSECKTIATDKEMAENLLVRDASKIYPIRCKLSERPSVFSLKKSILGSQNMRIQEVNWIMNF